MHLRQYSVPEDFAEAYPVVPGPFEPTWESLSQFKCPEWFRDAKFGIWAHWGPQSVPKAGDWYARNMYIEGHPQYKYHLEHYGHPSKVGYKDIVSQWRAERFDPEALIELYKRVGARYFVAMGCHHDNFDCWDSSYHRWNSVRVGPKKDIVGMWRDAARRHGLRFGVSEHMERCYSWFNTNKGADKEGPYAGVPYDGNDPEYEDFYFPPHDDTNHAFPINPPEWWKRQWFLRVKDLVEKYEPDLLYTDGGVPFGQVGLAMIANFYNNNIRRNNGELQAVYTLKQPHSPNHGEYREGIGVRDVERGVVDDIRAVPWQTDTCIGDWFYNQFVEYKTSETVIHMLVDIVSKNGNLLLNFPLLPDGTLDEKALKIAGEIGDWLRVNGEAIYDTRPWVRFGEGPTRAPEGAFGERQPMNYTSADFRFTTKGTTLYCIAMRWPEDKRLVVTSLALGGEGGRVYQVELLGHDGPLAYQQTEKGLEVQLPDTCPCSAAWTLKIIRE